MAITVYASTENGPIDLSGMPPEERHDAGRKLKEPPPQSRPPLEPWYVRVSRWVERHPGQAMAWGLVTLTVFWFFLTIVAY